MSFQFLASLNKAPIVTAAGAVVAGGLPFVSAAVATLPLGALQIANVLAFATNVAAVSVPGRLDGEQDQKMRGGNLNPEHEESASPLVSKSTSDDPMVLRRRTLVLPAGWAFAIWGPIYLGEAAFCVAQFVDTAGLASSLPQVTAPFVAANLLQSLWCASFRPSYNQGWRKYVSCAMLGGTAFALSHIPVDQSLYYLPIAAHFGWATAATLVNVNGSLAMSKSVSDTTLVAMGHSSAVLATLLGVGVTVLGATATPMYGFTVAWALAAVASGTKVEPHGESSNTLQKGARVQQTLCWIGSALCASTAALCLFP